MYQFGTTSKSKLNGVHSDLARVANRAIQISKIDFGIAEGVREYERQVELVRLKKSTTLHSKHLIQKSTGMGHAIDVYAFVNGKASYDWRYYGPIVQAFVEAGTALGVQLKFGHLWQSFTDSVHVELSGKYYP